MRITVDLLQKLAREQVKKSLSQNPDIVAVYLTGSVLSTDPLLGGATDIDMVMVHSEQPAAEREIIRISHEISLDIVHHHQSYYAFPRRLRLNPWLGTALSTHASILYDSDHWLEYVQAGIGTQYNLPENVYNRALSFMEQARAIWFDLEDSQMLDILLWFDQYFKAVGLAANGIAVLQGSALTNRRFLIDFPERVVSLGKPELNLALLNLLSAKSLGRDEMLQWRDAWQAALQAVVTLPACPLNLHAYRKAYFLSAYDALIEGGTPNLAIWLLIETWSMAIRSLGKIHEIHQPWLDFLSALTFTNDEKPRHVDDLDHFLDAGEELLLDWKNRFGIA
jgi:hypothetical protein